jgi:hypothetical protein
MVGWAVATDPSLFAGIATASFLRPVKWGQSFESLLLARARSHINGVVRMRFSVTRETQHIYDAYLNAMAAVIEKCLDFLFESFTKMADAYKADSPGDLAVNLLTRHILESIDGVAILVSKGSVQSCELLLRGSLEALASIHYLLGVDGNNRGLAFLAADVRRQLKYYRQCDPADDLGKDIRRRITGEAISGIIGRPPIKLVRKKIAALRADLADEPLRVVNEEYERQKAAAKTARKKRCPTCGKLGSSGRDPEWYSLFGGPKNIQELTNKTGLTALYELMYRPWSGTVHVGNTMRNLHEREDNIVLRQIRHPDGLCVMLRFSALITLPLAIKLVSHYKPQHKRAAMKHEKKLCKLIREVERTKNVSWKS